MTDVPVLVSVPLHINVPVPLLFPVPLPVSIPITIPNSGFRLFQTPLISYDLSRLEIDLVTVFDPFLTSRQTREKLQYLYENLMLNNLRKMTVLKKIYEF